MRALATAFRVASAPPRARAFDFSGGVLPAGAVLTRAGAATRIRADGLLETVDADVARFDHDPATRVLRGLLVEPARTNQMARAVGDGPGGCTITPGIADPAGGTSAVRLIVSGGDPAVSVYVPFPPDGRTITTTKFVRLPEAGQARAGSFAIASNYAEARFADYPVDATWRRIEQTVSGFASGAGGFVTRLDPFDGQGPGGTNTPPIGAAMDTAFWQIEEGASATSYIPVIGDAATTRAADVLTLDWRRRGVADGPVTIRYVFDDDSRAEVATVVADGHATVPTTLPRHAIRQAIAL